jgi:superfamily II DNA or RNA helicase
MQMMLLKKLEAYAGDLIYRRGVAYYLQGNIKKFKVNPLGKNHIQIQAIVQGTQSYAVNLFVRVINNTDLDIENYCSCPYDYSELCKHQVAVLYKFLVEDYLDLSHSVREKHVKPDGVELLKQVAQKDQAPKVELEYELKGLKKVASANFKLGIRGENVDGQLIAELIEDLGTELYNSYRVQKLLSRFDNFDCLVIEHLAKIQTRRDPKHQSVFLAKSKENLDFLTTLIESRKVYAGDSGEPLKLGGKLVPRVVLTGDENHLKIASDTPELNSPGFYHPDLDCFVKGNTLHLIDSSGIEQLPGEIEIPPARLGQLLFEVLPVLRKKMPLEIPETLSAHKLNLIEPEISLDFDYRDDQIVCRPEVKINEQVYHDKESLRLTTLEPEYSRAADNPHEWFTINQAALQGFLKFLEDNNFTVSPEGLTLKDQEQLLKFMLDGVKRIPPAWKVNTSPSFAEFKVSSVTLTPIVEMDMSGDINWFEFKIYYNLGGKTYTHQEILRMIKKTASGDRYIQTGGEIFLIDEPRALDLISGALLEEPAGHDHLRHELYNLFFYRLLFQDMGITIKGNSVYNRFEEEISGKNLIVDCEIPENLQGDLRQYQKEGFHWLRFLQKYNFGGILADDMGLGKTVQVLTLIKSLAKDTPTLVVCPRSLIYNWAAEIEKFYPGTRYLVYHGTPEERETMRAAFYDREFIITTYDILGRDAEELRNCPFFYCILDEAQHIKNHQTQRAKEVKRIKAKHRLVMTGTPIENGLDELWSVFDFLMPGYLESQPKFTARYVTPLKKSGEQTVLKLLKQKVSPFILRRKKEEVLTELPEKVVALQNVYMTKLQEDTYRAILEDLKDKILESINTNGLAGSRITVLAALTKLRQVCNHPKLVLPQTDPDLESGKLDTLMELIHEAIDAGHKMVVFSQFVKMLKIIEGRLSGADISYEYLDGSTRDRMERINHFNESPEIPVFLISLKAGGVGINLTSADIVIHVDPWWNPMVENQATDRVHRMGQTNQVMVYKLITIGTVEEKIIQLQKRKKSIFDAVIENNQSPVDSLTWDDIRELFEL